MNAERRKTIAEAAELVGRAKTLLEIARDDERGAFENLPESIQGSESGQAIDAAADQLGETVDSLEEIEASLGELAS